MYHKSASNLINARHAPSNSSNSSSFVRNSLRERRRALLSNPSLGAVSKRVLERNPFKLEWDSPSTFSITELNRLMAYKEAKPTMDCFSCKEPHSSSIAGLPRIPIVVGDRLFNGVFKQKNPEYRDTNHLEYCLKSGMCSDFIPGAILHLYSHYQQPLTIILLIGVNDLLRGRENEEILWNISTLKCVLEENEVQHGKVKNSNKLLISKVPLFPKIIGSVINHYQPFLNSKGMNIHRLNLSIMELNTSYGNNADDYPDFEGFGLRCKRLKSGVVRYSYERLSWREMKLEFAVHWSNAVRVTALSIMVSKLSTLLHPLLHSPPPPTAVQEAPAIKDLESKDDLF